MKKILSLVLALTAATTMAFSATETVNCGATVQLSATNQSGYHFVRWTKGGVEVSTSNPYTISNVSAAEAGTYTAVFAPDEYAVLYTKGSATGAAGSDVNDTKFHGIALTLKLATEAPFTRTGYTYDGWSTTDGGAKAYDFGGSYTGNAALTLYPHWVANTYTLTYNKGTYGTGNDVTQTKTHDVALTLLNATTAPFTREGYSHTGWSTTAAGTTKDYEFGASYTTEGDATLYPYWEINKYNVTYKCGSNSTGADIVVEKTYGVDLTLKGAGDFTREGYTQTGWSTTDGGAVTHNLGATYSGNADLTLYPVWEINVYTINFFNDATAAGGTKIGEGTFSKNYTHGATVTAPVCGTDFPVKTATAQYTYTFAGWDPNVSATATETVDYIAQWTATTNKYIVAFVNWDDSPISSSELAYGATVTKPTAPTRTGEGHTYTFQGWRSSVDNTLYAPDVALPTVTGAVTYKAEFSDETNNYTVQVTTADATMGSVVIKENGSEVGATVTRPYNTELSIVASAAECHEFVRWSDLAETDPNNTATRTVYATANVTYTAIFRVITYTIEAVPDNADHGSVTITIQ